MIDLNKLEDKQEVEGVFALLDIAKAKTKNGKDYYFGELQNNTGKIDFKIWEVLKSDIFDFTKYNKKAVKIKAVVNVWEGKKQLIIEGMRVAEESEIDKSELLPSYGYQKFIWAWGIIQKELEELPRVDGLYAVVSKTYSKYDREFKEFPAAKGVHHAKIYGYSIHIAGMLTIVNSLKDYLVFNKVNVPLLKAGILLHDAAKIFDYKIDVSIEGTDCLELIGHVSRGYGLLCENVKELGLQWNNELVLLGHLILSHHSKLEWGAAQRPKTIEAFLLHHIDMLDAILRVYVDFKLDSSGQKWSEKSLMLNDGGKILLNPEMLDRFN